MCSHSNAIGCGKVKGKARVESSKIGRGTCNDDVGLGDVPTVSSQDSGKGEIGEGGRRARTAKRRCTQEASDKHLAEKLQREWRAVGGKSNSVGAYGEQMGWGGTNHFMSRTQAGYMEANVRRGCCLCTDCAVSLAKVQKMHTCVCTTACSLVVHPLRGVFKLKNQHTYFFFSPQFLTAPCLPPHYT